MVSWNIVSRGDWLGNPANFKGTAYCFAFEVELHHHVTMTLHINQNNMADMSELFLFGDDLDAVLDILESEEDLEEQFIEAVDSVSVQEVLKRFICH
jgi:hypothetical protein